MSDTPNAHVQAIDQLRARAETAEKERDQALNYLYSLGRYYGRPRETNEHVESWAGRITKAIHDNQEPMAVSVQLREECEQLQAVNAKLKAEGLAAIERAKTAERQHVDAAARADAAEKERDCARRLWEAIAKTPNGGWHVAYEQAAAKLEAVTAERDDWKRTCEGTEFQTSLVLSFAHAVAEMAGVPRGSVDELSDWLLQVQTAVRSVTTERDAALAAISGTSGAPGYRTLYKDVCAELHAAKCRIADLEADDGPGGTEHQIVLHERNQLRDELAELRPQVEDLRAKLAAAEHRAVVCEHEADEAHRAVTVLSTIIRASVEAIARGVK